MSEPWTVEFKPGALKDIKKLDKKVRSKIFNYLDSFIEGRISPRAQGKPLRGNKSDFWSYRVGSYRIIANIQDKLMVITVVVVDHRKDVYKAH